MKAIEQYFPVMQLIMLYKVALTFDSVMSEILNCDHSNATKQYFSDLLFVLCRPSRCHVLRLWKKSYSATLQIKDISLYYLIIIVKITMDCIIMLAFPSLPKEASNPLAKCQSTMEVKIFVMVLSSNESMDMIFRCRVNRPEMSFRPPPGGPMAETKS